jgi:serine protease Do
MLGQLNDSLQRLARKVSPAVVQIEVTSFGSAGVGDRADASVIVRQHEIGAGVIVDPDGYIMTNAHVVEGAHRVRVTLSLPATASTAGFSAGRPRTLDARVIGSESWRIWPC